MKREIQNILPGLMDELKAAINKTCTDGYSPSENDINQLCDTSRMIYEKTILLRHFFHAKEKPIEITPAAADIAPVPLSVVDNFVISQQKELNKTRKKFPGEQPTIHDKIVPKVRKTSVVSSHEKKQLNDLKMAIGVNEKILFIHELFGKNKEEYSKAVDFINNCKDRNEAMEFISEELKMRFQWNDQKPAIASFIELVERRHAK